MNQNNKLIRSVQKTLTKDAGDKIGYRTVKSVFNLTEYTKNLLESTNLPYDLSNVGCKDIEVKGDGFYSAKLLINGSMIDLLHSSMDNDKEIAYIDLFKNNVVPFINDSECITLEIEHEFDIDIFFNIYEVDPIQSGGYVIDYTYKQYTGVEPVCFKGKNKIRLHCNFDVDTIYVLTTKTITEPVLVLDGTNYYPTCSSEFKYVFKFDKKINFTTDIGVSFLLFHNECASTEINSFIKTSNKLFVKPEGFGMPTRLIIDMSCAKCCVVSTKR